MTLKQWHESQMMSLDESLTSSTRAIRQFWNSDSAGHRYPLTRPHEMPLFHFFQQLQGLAQSLLDLREVQRLLLWDQMKCITSYVLKSLKAGSTCGDSLMIKSIETGPGKQLRYLSISHDSDDNNKVSFTVPCAILKDCSCAFILKRDNRL